MSLSMIRVGRMLLNHNRNWSLIKFLLRVFFHLCLITAKADSIVCPSKNFLAFLSKKREEKRNIRISLHGCTYVRYMSIAIAIYIAIPFFQIDAVLSNFGHFRLVKPFFLILVSILLSYFPPSQVCSYAIQWGEFLSWLWRRRHFQPALSSYLQLQVPAASRMPRLA